ncbi:MAG: MnhB domain-containing protein [Candidatus Omnitrophota bacterium]|nr:MnhB domain-containing protein [Candidatus Omnitrophota bacterium]
MNDNDRSGMTLIVKTVTRLTLGFILIYGVYIGLAGHSSPGGGFAGGVIIALSLVHIMLAFGREVALHRIHRGMLRVLAGSGALVFLYIVLCDPRVVLGGVALPICEMLIVGAGLFAIFVALVLLSKGHRDSE